MTIDSVLQAESRADYGFKNIPVIDMKDADSTDPAARQQLARDIRDACVNVGFFYVKNHDIPEESILGAIEAGKRFFALPEETKLKYGVNHSPSFKGYTALLKQNTDRENRGDLHESFNIGPEQNGSSKKSGLLDANPWPAEVDGFKEGYLGYYNKAIAFGKKFFPLFALALGLSENFFEDKTKENAAIMRVIRYPPQYGTVDDRVVGIGAHTDFECFTILWQEPGIEALQVLNANKEWVNATPIPGTLVINIGDQLARWTNDVFRSTVHRAVNRSGVLRHSMPVFFGVDYSVPLEPIPSCISEERPPNFADSTLQFLPYRTVAMAIDSVLQAASRADYSFKSIPVIDMKDADSTDPAARQQLARDIRDACVNVGFFYVKNHGIPEESITGAVEAGKRFFSLPDETKFKYDAKKTANFKGYTGLLSENNDPENRGDLHEAYDIGPDENESSKKSGLTGGNPWPVEVPGFKEGYLDYYKQAISFGKKLFPLFAIALGLPENFFEDKTQENAAVMRVVKYPPQFGPVDDRVIGIGAHTEYCFTILWQEPEIEALQVLNANKEWVNATPIPGTLVINIGDQLSRWTNDVFKSTVHRAINRSGVLRHSMPVFFGVDYNVPLEPIPSCVSPEHPPKYEVITAGEHVKTRLAAVYSYSFKP
ncbi:hypothetical protein ACEPAI_8963 [Sanghuangporus weigelae]